MKQFAIVLLLAVSAFSQVKREQFVVPTRDGVKLATEVARPEAEGRYPAVLVRTPYGRTGPLAALTSPVVALAQRGYAVVLQDTRGRFSSEGIFHPFLYEKDDGEDTLKWIVAQPWSNGKVGMYGPSYLGIVQWQAARSGHPGLVALAPLIAGSDAYRDQAYHRGGAFRLQLVLSWGAAQERPKDREIPPWPEVFRHLPLKTSDQFAIGKPIAFYQADLQHPSFDDYWKRQSVMLDYDRIKTPAFVIGGWFDPFVEGDLENFAALSKRGVSQKLLIGPWIHGSRQKTGEVEFTEAAKFDTNSLQLRWLDSWLKGEKNGIMDEPPLRIFVMGKNEWRAEQEWPLARARNTKFYLHAGGKLSAEAPGTELPDRYTYDPADPVPTRGGGTCCSANVTPWGMMDQREVEKRPDILSYTSEVLENDVEVTGPISVVLFASSSAEDTDFTAKLVDVQPDGKAYNLCDGILRARYRASLEKPELLKPDKVYQFSIPAGVTSNVFLKGHRIRLEVSSSNFPRFDRNLNTGADQATGTRGLKARQTIYHQRGRASYVLLPLIARSN